MNDWLGIRIKEAGDGCGAYLTFTRWSASSPERNPSMYITSGAWERICTR